LSHKPRCCARVRARACPDHRECLEQIAGVPIPPEGLVSRSFCFDPALGERPADNDQQCGDRWTKTVA
jgi:hypothetical protein